MRMPTKIINRYVYTLIIAQTFLSLINNKETRNTKIYYSSIILLLTLSACTN